MNKTIEEQKENIKEKYLKYCDTRFVNTFMKDIETLTLTAQKQGMMEEAEHTENYIKEAREDEREKIDDML